MPLSPLYKGIQALFISHIIPHLSLTYLSRRLPASSQTDLTDLRYNVAVTKSNKYDVGTDKKQRSDLIQFTVGYKFDL